MYSGKNLKPLNNLSDDSFTILPCHLLNKMMQKFKV